MNGFLKYGILAVLFYLTSCKKEQTDDNGDATQARVLILNEGNFGWGNASIGLYDGETQKYFPDYFQKQNNRPLGDVLQSALQVENEIYLVLNNSGVIEVIDAMTFKGIKTIKEMGSPRFMEIIKGGQEAYVTDIYANEIKRIHLKSGEVKFKIPLMGWSEHIASADGVVFWIENKESSKFYKLHADANKIVDSTVVLNEVQNVCKVKGSVYGIYKQSGFLYTIRLDGPPVEEVEGLAVEGSMLLIGEEAEVYYIRGKMLYAWKAGEQWLSDLQLQTLYGLSFDKARNEVWIFDAKDYTQNGFVQVVNKNGTLLYSFEAGALPSFALFLQ
jgi:hypothetical protein